MHRACFDCGVVWRETDLLALPLPADEDRTKPVCPRCADERYAAIDASDAWERRCVICGTIIRKPPSRASVCTRPDCQAERHNRRRRLLRPQRRCEYEYCGLPIAPEKRADARFCSTACRMAHNNALRFARKRPESLPVTGEGIPAPGRPERPLAEIAAHS